MGNVQQFIAQIIGAVSAVVYASAITLIVAKIVDAAVGLRVGHEEYVRLDVSQHTHEDGVSCEKFEDVKKALETKDYVAMAVNEVKGRGEQKVIILQFRGRKMEVDLLPKIEIFLVKNNIDAVVETITQNVRTGSYGGWKDLHSTSRKIY